MTKKDVKHLKEAICEFYLFVQKLKTFQELNFEAFRKINKKHDKIMNKSTGNEFMKDNIDNSRFNLRSLTLNIVRHLEALMTKQGSKFALRIRKITINCEAKRICNFEKKTQFRNLEKKSQFRNFEKKIEISQFFAQ